MKIAFVVPYLSGGGAERAASIFASLLSEFCENKVYFFAFYDVEQKYLLDQKVEYIPIFKNKESYKKTRKLKRLSIIKRSIQLKEVDVLIPFVTYVGYMLNIIFRKRKFLFIETVRNSPFIKQNFLKRKMRDFSIYHSDGIIFQTKYQMSYFNNKKLKKTLLLNNPISCEKFKEFETNACIQKFVFVGRLCEQKNPFLMLKAFAELVKEKPYCTLDIFGEGHLLDKCKELVTELCLDNNVSFKGFVALDREVLCNYDSFVLTSIVEGMPNALLESMSCGLICISSMYDPSTRELIDHKNNGYIFESNNLKELVDTLKEVSNMSFLDMRTMSINAINKIRNDFSFKLVSTKLNNFLQSYEQEKN